MPRWLCNSLVLTSVTKLKKRNEIICHEISLKKPIFNWEFSFQQPIFLRVKICRCLLSWGCYDPSIFYSVTVSPAPGNLDLNHKKGGLLAGHPWVGKSAHFFGGGFLVVFGWGPGGQEVKWFFKMIWWYPGDNNNASGSLVLQPANLKLRVPEDLWVRLGVDKFCVKSWTRKCHELP